MERRGWRVSSPTDLNIPRPDCLWAAPPTPRSLDLARSAGFTVAGQTQMESLGMILVVLEAPKGEPVRAAIKRLRALDPEGGYDFNHLYSGSGSLAASGDAAAAVVS